MKGAPITTSDPVVTYNECVTTESVEVLSKSANKHNRLFCVAQPLNEEVCKLFDEEVVGPNMDPKDRSKILREHPAFGWEEASTPQKIWCFGHDFIGPNVFCERTVGVAYLSEIKDSVVGGFKWACNEGPLCEERVRGLKMWLNDVTLHADAIHRGMGQISPTSRRVTYAGIYLANPALLEPIFLVNITCPNALVGSIYNVMSMRRGSVFDEGEGMAGGVSNMKAYLPVAESFGFSQLMGTEVPRQRGAQAKKAMGASGEDPTEQELEQFAGPGKGDESSDIANRDKPSSEPASDLAGEYGNIALLLILYTLQGIPMGISAVFPLILKERKVSYAELGTFSLNSAPFSFKLLWAPIVDAAYIVRIGRRKTWMVPSQLLIGVVMLGLSQVLEDLLFVDKPDVIALTVLFFFLYFLCATQDIAVDGWALTMLRPENVAYAATCNSIGQTLGYALGFTGFMALEHLGILSLSSFMFLWGLIFIVVTLGVAVLKTETPVPPEHEPEDIVSCYKDMMSILSLRPMKSLLLVLFTWKAGFAVVDGVAPLKFQEYGVSKEHMAYLTSILMPVYILLPAVVTKWTSGSEPFSLALQAYPWRAAMVPLTAALAYCTPAKMEPTPYGFYFLVLLLSLAGAVAGQCMFVSQMAFFARISDPAMGGTYMTMLNTIANLGGMWPPAVTFKLVDAATCLDDRCLVRADGFYVMASVCSAVGALWYILGASTARRLQHLKLSDWKLR